MGEIFKLIMQNREAGKKMLAVLMNPDKCHGALLASTIAALKTTDPDFIIIGGSLTATTTESLIDLLKEETHTKVILFPGHTNQVSSNADALLFMSLISGRNPEYLIGQQVHSAIKIKRSGTEVIPMGYILVEGEKKTSVEYISNTQPIPRDKKEIALATACAGELLGMDLIYLEAGSGSGLPVPYDMIQYVSQNISCPLIVGGGITTTEQMLDTFKAGADLVVIGTQFEQHPEQIPDFVKAAASYSSEKAATKTERTKFPA